MHYSCNEQYLSMGMQDFVLLFKLTHVIVCCFHVAISIAVVSYFVFNLTASCEIDLNLSSVFDCFFCDFVKLKAL